MSVGWLVGWLVGWSRKRLKCSKWLILTYFFIPITFHVLPHSFLFIHSFIHSSKTFIYKFLITRCAFIGLNLALFLKYSPRTDRPTDKLSYWLLCWLKTWMIWLDYKPEVDISIDLQKGMDWHINSFSRVNSAVKRGNSKLMFSRFEWESMF